MGKIPSRGSDQFVLRFPPGLRDQIREIAEKNGRSMNAEIIARLMESLETDAIASNPEASFEAMKPILDAVKTEVSERYEKRLAAIESVIGDMSKLVKAGQLTDDDLSRVGEFADAHVKRRRARQAEGGEKPSTKRAK